MYAIIEINGKQYQVAEKDEILLDKIPAQKIEAKVLLINDGKKVIVGKPEVKSAKIKIKVIKEEVLGKKVKVLKYKAKSRYRRHIGTRPQYTRVLIEKITG